MTFACFLPRMPGGSAEAGPSRSAQPGASEEAEDKGASRAHGDESEKEAEDEPSSSSAAEGAGQAKEGEGEGGEGGATESVLTEDDLIQQSQAEYDSGRYSPALMTNSELPLDAHVIGLDEDLQRLHLARRQLQVTGGWTRSHTHTHTHTHTGPNLPKSQSLRTAVSGSTSKFCGLMSR